MIEDMTEGSSNTGYKIEWHMACRVFFFISRKKYT